MAIKILLVDDDEDEHLFFLWSLEKIGEEISLQDAYTVPKAEEILMQITPDIIFLDINLPREDGFDCLGAIRQIPRLTNVPIYMYSTEITEKSMRLAAALGATGCLKKSRSYDVLGRNIMQLLKIPLHNVN
jgi:CheY-like chemotaxis protein